MKNKQFAKEVSQIQSTLLLDDWDITYAIVENPWFVWELTQVDYKRFQAYFTFAQKLLTESEEMIRSVIMHEFLHIFTISSLRYFSDDEYIKEYIGKIAHSEMIVRMDIINEQMTVRLERILTKLTLTP